MAIFTWSVALLASASVCLAAPAERMMTVGGRSLNPNVINIAPFGDTFTYGAQSVNENGYRQYLYDMLEKEGYKINFVGSQRRGKIQDNDHEGHNGYTIDNLTDKALPNLFKIKPDVILLNIGSTDTLSKTPLKLPERKYMRLIDTIFRRLNGTSLILTNLIPNRNATINNNVNAINLAINSSVTKRYIDRKEKIVFVDINQRWESNGKVWLQDDGYHPNENGYYRFAECFRAGMEMLGQHKFLTDQQIPPKKPKKRDEKDNKKDDKKDDKKEDKETEKDRKKKVPIVDIKLPPGHTWDPNLYAQFQKDPKA